MKSPAFQFYPKDWLSDPNVIAMTAIERGAYIQLLATMWISDGCHLKDDPEYLARVAQVDKVVITSLYPCFKVVKGWLRHKRLDQERQKQQEYRTKCSEAGKKGMQSRWEGQNLNQKTKGRYKVAITSDNSSSSSSSSSSITTNTKEEGTSPKGSDSPKRQLTDLWCLRYKETFNAPYMFQGAKDGKAADSLTSLQLPPQEIIEIALKAWRNSGGFWSKQASSLAGFASKFNEIRGEIGALKQQAIVESIADSWTNYKKQHETKNLPP